MSRRVHFGQERACRGPRLPPNRMKEQSLGLLPIVRGAGWGRLPDLCLLYLGFKPRPYPWEHVGGGSGWGQLASGLEAAD